MSAVDYTKTKLKRAIGAIVNNTDVWITQNLEILWEMSLKLRRNGLKNFASLADKQSKYSEYKEALILLDSFRETSPIPGFLLPSVIGKKTDASHITKVVGALEILCDKKYLLDGYIYMGENKEPLSHTFNKHLLKRPKHVLDTNNTRLSTDELKAISVFKIRNIS